MYKTIVVVDEGWCFDSALSLPVIPFQQYLKEYPKLNQPKVRVVNLCDFRSYPGLGYYCSLLAEARQHAVLPSVSVINDVRHFSEQMVINLDFSAWLPKAQDDGAEQPASRSLSFFGWVAADPWKKLARQLFERYPLPIAAYTISFERGQAQLTIQPLSFSDLTEAEQSQCLEQLMGYSDRVWRRRTAVKRQQRWDMAIVVDSTESHPPSDKEAIKRFIKAAASVNIHADVIDTPIAQLELAQYDALFLRQTTYIDHPTYQLARKAEAKGLVVMDDPTSILRCCNKIFLHDAFSYQEVPTLKTLFLLSAAAEELDFVEAELGYPMVLKMPESSFSKGVFKITDRAMLQERVEALLPETSMLLLQAYLYTEFDWRIGILNNRPIYACRYFMARNHWQIYNHGVKRNRTGSYETLPTYEVPKPVLKAAVKAAEIIGNGLYGVDIKQQGQQVYVMEVNDNPSIDQGVEDEYLGNDLYRLIMGEFAQRLEKRGR